MEGKIKLRSVNVFNRKSCAGSRVVVSLGLCRAMISTTEGKAYIDADNQPVIRIKSFAEPVELYRVKLI